MSTEAPPSPSLRRVFPAEQGMRWIVVHARPRCEKRVEEFAQRGGLRWYLPLRRRTHRYGSRVRSFTTPLFPGYVFCVVDDAAARTLRQNRHVANVIDTADQEGLVRQLEQVERALTAGDVLDVLPFVEAGKRIRVVDGPLKGIEGYVQRVQGPARVFLNVDILQCAVVVEVDSSHLGPV